MNQQQRNTRRSGLLALGLAAATAVAMVVGFDLDSAVIGIVHVF